jgi:hypothetical protein
VGIFGEIQEPTSDNPTQDRRDDHPRAALSRDDITQAATLAKVGKKTGRVRKPSENRVWMEDQAPEPKIHRKVHVGRPLAKLRHRTQSPDADRSLKPDVVRRVSSLVAALAAC